MCIVERIGMWGDKDLAVGGGERGAMGGSFLQSGAPTQYKSRVFYRMKLLLGTKSSYTPGINLCHLVQGVDPPLGTKRALVAIFVTSGTKRTLVALAPDENAICTTVLYECSFLGSVNPLTLVKKKSYTTDHYL
jgi:hypothetical protein